MGIDVRMSELLEELHDSGRTPEDVCSDFPELLPELRERWRRVRHLEAELDRCFPPEREGPRQAQDPPREPANLPRIPGYEVEALLGRGGMGVVFRARHVRLNRVVAIKMAIAGAYAEQPERERFQREAEAVAALRHPHVVQIYDVGDSEGRPFYAMEYVAGGSLAAAAKPMAPREAAALLLPLAGAIQAAHAGGIIHRDLKPANILLDEDGTPKVGDFGLSRRIDDASALTLNGMIVGTPSYMAPEQAVGDREGVGIAVDVYALGAILYELLTGRPPFRGQTHAETARQVVSSEPVPPATLNPKVPRDLEIVCLKCLSKDQARRYPSAELLGADLRRFLDGEAIEAKPEGRAGRILRRIRRNPRTVAMLGCIALLAGILAGVGLWLAADRAELARRAAAERAAGEQAAREDLRDMGRAMGKRAWGEARAALDRSAGRLGEGGSAELREIIERGRRDLDIVARLEAIRMDRARSVGGLVDYAAAGKAYEQAFRGFGLGGPDEAPEVVAARVAASGARPALVDALDDWPIPITDAGRKGWTLRVARLASGDESGWVARARDPDIRRSRPALERLIATAPVEEQPVTLLLAIAEDLRITGGDPVPILARIQRARPGDYWANLSLGSALGRAGRHAEAIRYQQAGLSLRPDAAIGYNNLGRSLADSGRPDDAADYFRAALRIDPTATISSYNLGAVLRLAGRIDESIEQYRSALRLTPESALLRAGLGDALSAASKPGEALTEYRRAAAIDPGLATAQAGLRTTHIQLGQLEEARAAWLSAIEISPGQLNARDGYAEFCLFLGREDDYREQRHILLETFGDIDSHQAAERIGRACLLLPLAGEEASKAALLIDRALDGGPSPPPAWTRPYFLFAKGLAEYRLGRFEGAIVILKGDAAPVMGPCPLLITAMAQHRLEREDEARRSLAAAVRSHDWGARADTRETWIYHILRREAEMALGPARASREH